MNLLLGMPALFLVCVHTQLEDWLLIAWMPAWMFGLLRSCFPNDLFLTGASQGILTQEEERFPQHSFVKAGVAMWGKIRVSLTYFFAQCLYERVKMLFCVAYLCILFFTAITRSFTLFCSSPWSIRSLSHAHTCAIFCSVILQSFLTCSGWLL